MNKVEKLVQEGGIKKDFVAQKLEISPNTLTNKLKGRRKWNAKEISKMKELYSLTADQTVEIFLT